MTTGWSKPTTTASATAAYGSKDGAYANPDFLGAPKWPGHYESFSSVHQGPRTEKSMSLGHQSLEIHKYRSEVKGIVPGYAGHVPRARDQYGESAVGGMQPTAWGNTRHMGSAEGHSVNPYGQNELLADEKKWQKEEERFRSYDNRNGGVMPNYAGHRPGARAVEATSAFGKWRAADGAPGGIGGKVSSWQLNDTADFTGLSGNSESTTGSKISYRAQVGGVLPGYQGFVPGSINKCGGSHYGGVSGWSKEDGLNHKAIKVDEDGDFYGLEQKGHGRDHKETTTAGGVKSGYAGHLPGARDTWGMTHYDTINMDANGVLRGKPEYVSDGVAGNEFTGQAKTYHDDVKRALHEH